MCLSRQRLASTGLQPIIPEGAPGGSRQHQQNQQQVDLGRRDQNANSDDPSMFAVSVCDAQASQPQAGQQYFCRGRGHDMHMLGLSRSGTRHQSSVAGIRAGWVQGCTLPWALVPRLCGCCPPQVKEPLLVRDVLYACQGINGKYTAYQVRALGGSGQTETGRGLGCGALKETGRGLV